MRRAVLRKVVWVALLAATAPAGAVVDDRAERERIASERAATEARFVEQERACQQRFAVTACVQEAQRERRASLARLRGQQTQLDDEKRRQRAAERTESIRSKAEKELSPAGQPAPAPATGCRRRHGPAGVPC